MRNTIHNAIIIASLVILIAILLYSCKEKGKEIHGGIEEESQNYKFSEFIKNIQTFPYEAGSEKRKKVIEGFAKLTLGMKKEEVKKLLGEPDAEFFSYNTTKVKTYVGSSWGYYLSRHKAEYANDYDQVVYIYFNTDEKLYWAKPDNIDLLRSKGRPHISK